MQPNIMDAAVRRLNVPALVMVSREARGWRAEVVAVGVVRRARSLTTLDRAIRELLGTSSVDYHFHTGDAELDRLVMHIRAARAAARRYDERAQRLTTRALRLPSGGSGRDLSILLSLSYQRIHQLQRLSTVEGR
jgi:hypothetical protein